jgi:glycosyltransferase involved in cell wall biosynthesis
MTSAGLKLSVVMPLFNKRAFVHRAVTSVLAQDHGALELLVVDDGSTDGSVAALKDIEDPRLQIITQANAGVAHARNRGLAAARGEWIALIDADDAWAPDHLDEIAAMAAFHPQAGLVATSIREVWTHQDGNHGESPLRSASEIREIDYFWEAVRNGHVVTSSSVALRSDVAREIGGFRDLRPGEDIDCWVRIAMHWPIVISSRVTAFYLRGTGGSAMDGWGAKSGRKRKIASREGFGGTVAVIDAALASGEFEGRRATMQAYADARMLSNAGNSLAAGDREGAADRLRLIYCRQGRRFWAYWLLSRLPGSMVRIVIAVSRGFRHRLRR